MASVKLFLACILALLAVSLAEDIDFTGRYKMTVSDKDNYNELLKKLDIGYFKRLAATNSNSEYVISYDKDTKEYTFQTVTTFSSAALKFKSGVEFDEPRADGNTVKSTITINGNTWNHVQKGNPMVTIERVWNGNVITVTTKCDDVTVVRKYEKQ